MPIRITLQCRNCGWATAADTDDGNYDEAARKAQRHANKEDHVIVVQGTISPEDK